MKKDQLATLFKLSKERTVSILRDRTDRAVLTENRNEKLGSIPTPAARLFMAGQNPDAYITRKGGHSRVVDIEGTTQTDAGIPASGCLTVVKTPQLEDNSSQNLVINEFITAVNKLTCSASKGMAAAFQGKMPRERVHKVLEYNLFMIGSDKTAELCIKSRNKGKSNYKRARNTRVITIDNMKEKAM